MTSLKTQRDPADLLRHLMELDWAAAEGFRLASERVADPEYRSSLAAFQADYERHWRELEPLCRRAGGEPPPHAKVKLLPGMVTVGDKRGDQAVLLALENNERGTLEGCSDALDLAPQQAVPAIEGLHEDVRRHLQWLGAALGDLEAGASYRGTPR